MLIIFNRESTKIQLSTTPRLTCIKTDIRGFFWSTVDNGDWFQSTKCLFLILIKEKNKKGSNVRPVIDMSLKIHSDFTNQVYGTVEKAAQLVTPGEHIGDKALIISGNKSSWGNLLVTFRRQKGKKTTTTKNPNKSGGTDTNMSFFYYNTLMLWFKIFLEIKVWEKYQFYATLG